MFSHLLLQQTQEAGLWLLFHSTEEETEAQEEEGSFPRWPWAQVCMTQSICSNPLNSFLPPEQVTQQMDLMAGPSPTVNDNTLLAANGKSSVKFCSSSTTDSLYDTGNVPHSLLPWSLLSSITPHEELSTTIHRRQAGYIISWNPCFLIAKMELTMVPSWQYCRGVDRAHVRRTLSPVTASRCVPNKPQPSLMLRTQERQRAESTSLGIKWTLIQMIQTLTLPSNGHVTWQKLFSCQSFLACKMGIKTAPTS